MKSIACLNGSFIRGQWDPPLGGVGATKPNQTNFVHLCALLATRGD